jgi:hypothetical protein
VGRAEPFVLCVNKEQAWKAVEMWHHVGKPHGQIRPWVFRQPKGAETARLRLPSGTRALLCPLTAHPTSPWTEYEIFRPVNNGSRNTGSFVLTSSLENDCGKWPKCIDNDSHSSLESHARRREGFRSPASLFSAASGDPDRHSRISAPDTLSQ